MDGLDGWMDVWILHRSLVQLEHLAVLKSSELLDFDQRGLVPGRFLLMITVPVVDPSPILVIITVINHRPGKPYKCSERAPLVKI